MSTAHSHLWANPNYSKVHCSIRRPKILESDENEDEPKLSRHYVYTKHFPLNYEDPLSQHDCNQRYILLFGVGKERDEKKHAVKKMAKGMRDAADCSKTETEIDSRYLSLPLPLLLVSSEISKLYSKKFSMDMGESGKVKKNSRVDYNFESTTTRFQAMTYFDQHAVTWQCSSNVLEMIRNFASGGSNYLPVQEHVAYLFDLMETAVNIYGLIELCMSIVKDLPLVESQLIQKRSSFVKAYTTSMSLYIVGVLRRYMRCLLRKLSSGVGRRVHGQAIISINHPISVRFDSVLRSSAASIRGLVQNCASRGQPECVHVGRAMHSIFPVRFVLVVLAAEVQAAIDRIVFQHLRQSEAAAVVGHASAAGHAFLQSLVHVRNIHESASRWPNRPIDGTRSQRSASKSL